MATRLPRSRSVDLSLLSRESYLSRWSRENTPIENISRYESNCRRSYTPVREVAGYKVINDTRRPYTPYRARTPLGAMTVPYHTNLNYDGEREPLRKYDVFQVRTWSYPIYKYIYRGDTNSERPYSYTRTYANTPVYTPPQMTPEIRPITTRKGYSGFSYLASESNFDITSRPRSTQNFYLARPFVPASPYFSKSYMMSSSLRHFNSYRPRPYFTKYSSYSAPYY